MIDDPVLAVSVILAIAVGIRIIVRVFMGNVATSTVVKRLHIDNERLARELELTEKELKNSEDLAVIIYDYLERQGDLDSFYGDYSICKLASLIIREQEAKIATLQPRPVE